MGERPGATAGEVAAATAIARPTVASTLGKLARSGELETAELPGAGVGYRLARPAVGDVAEAADDRAAERAAGGSES
jgi:DNA-binding IscR family transcriptional regulator